jgi:hypothetical protein
VNGPYFATVSPQGAHLVLNALAMIEILDESHIVAIAEIARRREDWVAYFHPGMMRRVALSVLAFSDELHQEAA